MIATVLLFLAVYTLTILSGSFILAHNSLPWVLASACRARALGPTPATRFRRRQGAPPARALHASAVRAEGVDPSAPVIGRRGRLTPVGVTHALAFRAARL